MVRLQCGSNRRLGGRQGFIHWPVYAASPYPRSVYGFLLPEQCTGQTPGASQRSRVRGKGRFQKPEANNEKENEFGD